jgi:hypothetical protein
MKITKEPRKGLFDGRAREDQQLRGGLSLGLRLIGSNSLGGRLTLVLGQGTDAGRAEFHLDPGRSDANALALQIRLPDLVGLLL